MCGCQFTAYMPYLGLIRNLTLVSEEVILLVDRYMQPIFVRRCNILKHDLTLQMTGQGDVSYS